jgi:hypothetical protein
MTSHTEAAHQKIQDAAEAAKKTADKLVEAVADAAHSAVDKVREGTRDVGEAIQETGSTIAKEAK